MATFHNRALQQESIGEPAAIIAPRKNESLFKWIQSTGRFKSYESDKYQDNKAADELEDILEPEEELAGEE
jgi:hypothetical protein